MIIRRLLTTVWLAIALPFIASACAGVTPVVKIGLVGPFVGRERARGYDVIYSARLAVRQANAAGGADDYRVELVTLDDGGDPELALATAAALAADPAVVAVIGHWLPETTAAALPVYEAAGLPFVATTNPPYGPVAPADLPAEFRQAYEAVTPFDEVAGPLAGPAYDAVQLALAAIGESVAENGRASRVTVAAALAE